MSVLQSYLMGREAARVQKAADRQDAMNTFLAQQGPAIFAGDQGALGQLAGFGPEGLQTAFNVQGSMDVRADREATRGREDWRFKREVEQYAAGLTAQQAAEAAAENERAIAAGLAAQTPEQFDALVTQLGAAQLVGQFANREAIAMSMVPLVEALKMRAKAAEAPSPVTVSPGETLVDPRTGKPIYAAPPKAAEGFTLGEGQVRFGPDGRPIADVPKAPTGTADIQEYEFARSQGFNGSFADWQVQNRRAGATTVNVGGGSDKQVFDAMQESANAAAAAAGGLAALREASNALAGGTITGFAANQRLDAARLGALLGVTDPAVIQNTETFRSAMAPQIAALMKATVGSQQISNADREFAEKAAGGAITLDEGSIRRLLGIMERAALVAIDRHQTRLDAVYPDNGQFQRERALFAVGASGGAATPAPGQGSPPVVIDGFTIEEAE